VLMNKVRQIEACSFSETLEFPLVLGRDFSGRAVAKGLGVGHDVNIGDEVWGAVPAHLQGCHAQFVRVNKSLVRNCILLIHSFIHSFYLTLHRSTKTFQV